MNKKGLKPNVVKGGKAIPLGKNYYYMKGRKHETGGIDIGANSKDGLEVEDGEVMHLSKDEVKVFSSVPILNGESPAKKVMGGENPNKVFKAQERFKDKNNLNDDGTKKKRMGGLNRKDDYGSSKKPYPTVSKQDFAGGHRSYPIPTKADAVDALRLASLHGRSDVKSKVYSKYPELTKKALGGSSHRLVEVNIGGKKKLIRVSSSTGERPKAELGSDIIRKKYDSVINDEQRAELDKQLRGKVEKPIERKSVIDKTENKEKDGQVGQFKLAKTLDYIGLGANLAGSVIGGISNNKTINKMKYNKAPTPTSAAKLKTKININPQLDRMRESLGEYTRDVDANTASSRVALARKQRARTDMLLKANEIQGAKENMETELINRDKLNQQSVDTQNNAAYNRWSEGKSAFENRKKELKSENIIGTIEGVNSGLQSLIDRIERRRSDNNNISATASANPNVDARIMKDKGVNFDYIIKPGESKKDAIKRTRLEKRKSKSDKK